MPPEKSILPTRKHLARARRERLVARLVLILVGVVLAAVVGLIVYGLAEQEYLLPRRAAATVNGEVITRQELIARMALAQADLLEQRQSLEEMLAFFVESPEAQRSIQQQVAQLTAQLEDVNAIAAQVLEELIRARLIRQEAQRRGIVVSEADIDRAVAEAFGFFPEGTPAPRPTSTTDPVLAAQSTPTSIPTERPTGTPTATATSGPSPTPADTATPRPTATPLTREGFEAAYRQYLEDLRARLGVSETHFRDRFAERLYRERLRDSFRAEVPRDEEQVWAKHILVPDQAVAYAILSRLRQGEDWDALAAAYSTDTANKDRGGDLGWFGRGAMIDAFEAAAFATDVGEIAGPVQTSFGWHLILIVDRGERRLNEAAFEAAVDRAFSEWLASALEAAELVFDPGIVPPTATPAATSTAAEPTPRPTP